MQSNRGEAQDFQWLLQWRTGKRQRAGVITALVPRQATGSVTRTPEGRRESNRQGSLPAIRRYLGWRCWSKCSSSPEIPGLRGGARDRPLGLTPPPSGDNLRIRIWRTRLLHPDSEHGLAHDAGIDALQPVVPPADHLAQVINLRAGMGDMGHVVQPGANQPFPRHAQVLQHMQHEVMVAVGPTADGEHWTLNGLPVLIE